MISFPYTSVKKIEGSTVSYDRAIDSKVKRLYNMLRYTQGVAVDIGGGFQVLADSGMNVKVHCNGTWGHVYGDFCYEEQEYVSVTLDPADATYDRIDCIMLRNDISTEKRSIEIFYVKGTPASSPTVPALTSTPEIHEKCLAQILVQRNVSSISQSNITDTRLNAKLCGIMTNAFGEIDASQFFAQLESQAKDLQEAIKDIASGSGTMLQVLYDPRKIGEDVFAYPGHLYKATLKFDDWSGDGTYTQTAILTPMDNGPDVTADTIFYSEPMCEQVSDASTREKLLEALALINDSECVLGDNQVTVSGVKEKPTVDIEVVWQLKKGGV